MEEQDRRLRRREFLRLSGATVVAASFGPAAFGETPGDADGGEGSIRMCSGPGVQNVCSGGTPKTCKDSSPNICELGALNDCRQGSVNTCQGNSGGGAANSCVAGAQNVCGPLPGKNVCTPGQYGPGNFCQASGGAVGNLCYSTGGVSSNDCGETGAGNVCSPLSANVLWVPQG